jgi:hypothetical protein
MATPARAVEPDAAPLRRVQMIPLAGLRGVWITWRSIRSTIACSWRIC